MSKKKRGEKGSHRKQHVQWTDEHARSMARGLPIPTEPAFGLDDPSHFEATVDIAGEIITFKPQTAMLTLASGLLGDSDEAQVMAALLLVWFRAMDHSKISDAVDGQGAEDWAAWMLDERVTAPDVVQYFKEMGVAWTTEEGQHR